MTQTIRQMTGASAPESLDPATTALLVIDFQKEYFDGRMPIPDGAKALANARRLIDKADASGTFMRAEMQRYIDKYFK